MLKSSLDLSHNITTKTLEATTANIDKSLATTQTGISESFRATNASTKKNLNTYVTTTYQDIVNSIEPVARYNNRINSKIYNSGNSNYNSNADTENYDEDLAHSNKDYP